MTRTRLMAIFVGGSCLLALAACGGGKKQGATPTNTRSAPTATATAATSSIANTPAGTAPATTSTGFQGGREPVEGSLGTGGATPSPSELVDVRAADHSGFDRITFEFDGDAANFRVEYVSSPTQCGSGAAVSPGEQAKLQVRFTPAAAHNDQGTPTFGLTILGTGLQSIVQAVQTCDFEADVTWVLIVTQEVNFRVVELDNPPRVAVDVAHP